MLQHKNKIMNAYKSVDFQELKKISRLIKYLYSYTMQVAF